VLQILWEQLLFCGGHFAAYSSPQVAWASSSRSERPASIAESTVNRFLNFIVAQKCLCYNIVTRRGGIVLKKSFGARYLHLATKKPWFFYSVLLFGVALFLFLTLTTKIETESGIQTLFHIIFVRAGKGL